MDSIVDSYASWLRSWGASKNTVTARTQVAAYLLRTYGLEGITADNLQAWLARTRSDGAPLSRWTRATNFAAIKCFCSWLHAAGYLTENPVDGLRSPTRPKSLPRPLSEAEVEVVLAAATGRVRDWIQLALLAGLRAHEIAKLRGEDVSSEFIYVEGKDDTRAEIPTHPELWLMAQRYPRRGYWFPGRFGDHIARATITTQVGLVFGANGIDGSIHRCRHVYGTRLLRAGVNVRTVQRLMRHANLETTAIYTAVDENELRSAIGKLSA